MHDTLSSLVERALTGNPRPLEFYLRENSRLPGPRANLELANDVSTLLAAAIARYPESVRSLLHYFVNGDRKWMSGNTPSEFVILCGIIAAGACAASESTWQEEMLELLDHYACSPYWRIREGVAIAFQHMLPANVPRMLKHLRTLALCGDYLQQRAAIATLAEPHILVSPQLISAALDLQRMVLSRAREVPLPERKQENFRTLRRTLAYTLSVATAASPDEGFALMRECAAWNDSDINWILRENLKKKRLARFAYDTQLINRLLATPYPGGSGDAGMHYNR
ncbi:hypothetical protein [Ktedonospora formicarum]|nr:hypothetical protein [Ktedonospora formicarum]